MILLVLILFLQSTNITVNAAQETELYARVLFDEVYFYKTPNENALNNIYFELPKTYFVKLIDKNENFYQAEYLNIVGYVKKDSVQAVLGTPIKPYLNNITFRVYSELSTNLHEAPSQNSTLKTKIPILTNNIQYISQIEGESLISGRTNIWYYCKFTSENVSYYGYVYSDFCDEMQPILNNTESLEYTNNPTFEPYFEPPKAIPKNSNIVGVVVAILSIPALIFVFLIMNGTKILNQNKIKRKEVIDY